MAQVARALANVAASEQNHAALMDEGALALCLDLVVSNSVDVQVHPLPSWLCAPLPSWLCAPNPPSLI